MITAASYWVLLLLAVPLFWLLPKQWRAGFLATVSFAYIAWLDWQAGGAMLAWTLGFYALAPLAASGREGRLTTILVLGILGYLAAFKYLVPFVFAFAEHSPGAAVAIPLGISYFTFKLIHYVVEVTRGNIEDRSLAKFLCYAFLFPIFTGGPIERFDHFLANQEEKWSAQQTAEGITRIAHGLIKRFVIVEHLMRPMATEELLAQLPEIGAHRVWLYCVATFLCAYLDFSALSDIAIGSSRLFGLRIQENFDWPILARNISEFWSRWHMTLVGWCQSYVYMPILGWTRQPYLATLCTFLVMGLWHAGTLHWVGWGLYHASGVIVFRVVQRRLRARGWRPGEGGLLRYLGIAATILFVSGGSAFTSVYGHGSVLDSLRVLLKMVGVNLSAA